MGRSRSTGAGVAQGGATNRARFDSSLLFKKSSHVLLWKCHQETSPLLLTNRYGRQFNIYILLVAFVYNRLITIELG